MVDDAVIETARAKLYAAVLSDVLDGLGYRHQVLPPHIRPLRRGAGPGRPCPHRPLSRRLSCAGRPQSLRARDRPDRRPEAGRRAGARLRRFRPDRALGRAPDHREPRTRRHRLHHRRSGARHRELIRAVAFPGLPRRHRPARFQGPGRGLRDRRADRVRGRHGQSRRSGVRRCRRRPGRAAADRQAGAQARLSSKVEGEDRTRAELQGGAPASPRSSPRSVRRPLSQPPTACWDRQPAKPSRTGTKKERS